MLLELKEGLSSLESKDRNGFRPLHRAVTKNAVKSVQLLVCLSILKLNTFNIQLASIRS